MKLTSTYSRDILKQFVAHHSLEQYTLCFSTCTDNVILNKVIKNINEKHDKYIIHNNGPVNSRVFKFGPIPITVDECFYTIEEEYELSSKNKNKGETLGETPITPPHNPPSFLTKK
jgi:hypothetical protein